MSDTEDRALTGQVAQPVAPARPVATAFGLLMPLLMVLMLSLVLIGSVVGGARWLLGTEAGATWLLQRLPGVQVEGWRGALWGPDWSADKLQARWAGGKESVLIEGLQAQGVELRWRPSAGAWIGLEMATLNLQRVTVQTGDPGKRPLPSPKDIAGPAHLLIRQVDIREMQIDTLPMIRALKVQQLVLDPEPGARHRFEQLGLDWSGLRLVARGGIGTAAPLPVSLQASVSPLNKGLLPDWAASLQLDGPLALMALSGKLQVAAPGRGLEPGHVGPPAAGPAGAAAGSSGAGVTPPAARPAAAAVELQATLQVLEAWPMAELELRTQALNLAALRPQLPRTSLSGSLRFTSPAQGAPITAQVALQNLLPGRIDAGMLPVSTLSAQAIGRLDQPGRLDFSDVQMTLADATGAAGSLSGDLSWQAHQLQLNTHLDKLQPHRLDNRAAAMTLSGPLSATLNGLPSPDPAARTSAGKARVQWQTDLMGSTEGAPQPVRLVLQGNADAKRIELSQATASSGKATAALNALLQHLDNGQWQLTTAGSLKDFEPLPWWPGDVGGAWRKGPHRISGDWKLQLQLPEKASALPPLEMAQQLAGNGDIQIADALLAGVPITGTLSFGYRPGPAPVQTLPSAAASGAASGSPGAATPGNREGPARASSALGTLQAELLVGGNQLKLEARGDPVGGGQGDRLRLELDAKQLAALAPWTQLHPALAEWVPKGGSVTVQLSAQGRWPRLRTEGQMQISQLRAGQLSLATGSASWQLDMGGGQPLSLQLDTAGLQYGTAGKTQRADHLRANVQGTLAEHRLEVSAALPISPPEQLMRLLNVPTHTGTRMLLQGQGSWAPGRASSTPAGGTWSGTVQRLQVGAWDGSPNTAPPVAGWIDARDLRAELLFDGEGQLLALQAEPGRVLLANEVALRWQAMQVDLRPAQAHLKLQAEVEDFAVVTLLQRLLPDVRWQGDLKMTAKIDIQATDRIAAEIVVERRTGDISIRTGDLVQPMGLSEVRLGLSVADGVWQFTPVFKGRALGEVAGSARIISSPEKRWPEPKSPLQGVLTARVADIGIWNAWIPAGWRLAGELTTRATLGGTFGAPQYIGELTGQRLAVRNILQGVNIGDGQVRMRLEGETATIESFTMRAGDKDAAGTLSVTGGATFGTQPKVDLRLEADRFRLLGRVDRRLFASGTARLQMDSLQTQVDGKFKVDEALFDTAASDAPTLDADVNVRMPGQAEERAEDTRSGARRRTLNVKIEVDLGENLRVRGRGLDTALRGQLRIAAPGGRPALYGTIRTYGGTYAAYGQKLEIERGNLEFSGPVNNPRLDVLALRPGIDTRAGVSISGNLLTLRVRLYSEPDMSDSDKLSWLVLGRAPDGLGRTETALLQRAAIALLAGEEEAPTDAFLRTLGIDELSLRQSDGEVRDTVVTLGKQLSQRWYLGYERGVNATTGTWQLIYRIAQRLTVRAQSGLENSIDVIWILRRQETPADAGMTKSTILPRP